MTVAKLAAEAASGVVAQAPQDPRAAAELDVGQRPATLGLPAPEMLQIRLSRRDPLVIASIIRYGVNTR